MHFTPGLQSAICVFIFLQISELALMKWAEKITRKIANKYSQSKHDSICHVSATSAKSMADLLPFQLFI